MEAYEKRKKRKEKLRQEKLKKKRLGAIGEEDGDSDFDSGIPNNFLAEL